MIPFLERPHWCPFDFILWHSIKILYSGWLKVCTVSDVRISEKWLKYTSKYNLLMLIWYLSLVNSLDPTLMCTRLHQFFLFLAYPCSLSHFLLHRNWGAHRYHLVLMEFAKCLPSWADQGGCSLMQKGGGSLLFSLICKEEMATCS